MSGINNKLIVVKSGTEVVTNKRVTNIYHLPAGSDAEISY